MRAAHPQAADDIAESKRQHVEVRQKTSQASPMTSTGLEGPIHRRIGAAPPRALIFYGDQLASTLRS
jgi:hypothetical protein